MPTFEVAIPDGKLYQIEAPDFETAVRALAGAPQQAAPKPSPITTGGLLRAAAEGVPIAGGFVNKGIAAAKAGVPSMLGGSTAPTFGERYAADLPVEEAASQKFATEHPIAANAAGLAGGVAATLPLGATALGARMLGLGGRTLTGQIARGAASGAGINAIDALVRGNDPGVAAGVGGAIGAAVPPAARLAGAAAGPVANVVRGIINPTEEAARRVSAGIARDVAAGGAGLTDAQFQAARAAGAPVKLMDLGGETTRAVARSAANTSQEGRQVLSRNIDAVFEGQSQRASDHLRSRMNYPTEEARQQAINDVRENVYEPAYARAYRDSANVPLWPDRELIARHTAGMSPADAAAATGAMRGLEQLAQAPEVQQAIRNAIPLARNWAVRDGLRAPSGAFTFEPDGRGGMRTVLQDNGGASSPFPSLQMWDYVKRALDRMGTPTAATFAREIRGNLDTLVPSYQAAREAAHPVKFFGGASNAFDAGRDFVNRGQQYGTNAQTQLMRMTPQERNLFQDGYASAVAERIERSPDRRNVLNNISNSPAARQELETALGPQRWREMEGMLRVEGVMDLARGAVQGNSTTARQLMELGLAGGAGSMLSSGSPFGDPASALNAALVWGAIRHGGGAALNRVDERVARQVAQLLTSNDPAQLRMGARTLANNPRMLAALRNFDTALGRSAAAQVDQRNQ